MIQCVKIIGVRKLDLYFLCQKYPALLLVKDSMYMSNDALSLNYLKPIYILSIISTMLHRVRQKSTREPLMVPTFRHRLDLIHQPF